MNEIRSGAAMASLVRPKAANLYFCYKWSGTWNEEPKKEGWIKNWKKEFIENPPNFAKSKVKIFYRYIYFEKDIYDLYKKNYLT